MYQWRNKLVALVCVLVFIGLASLYYKGWVLKSPFSVVLVLVDDFNLQTIARERFAKKNDARELRLDRFEQSALVHLGGLVQGRSSVGDLMSQFSTGSKPGRGKLAMDDRGGALPTLLDKAHASGRSTGIVTNGHLSSPILAPFYANVGEEATEVEVLSQLVDVERVDVVFGGVERGVLESEGRSLREEIKAKGYDVAASMLDVLKRPEWKFPRMAGFFEPSSIQSSVGFSDPASPTLPKLVRASIRFLQYNRRGYLLVVHVARPLDGTSAVAELDETLRSVRDFTGGNSLVVVCGLPEQSGAPVDLLSFAHGAYAAGWSGTKSPREMHELLSKHF